MAIEKYSLNISLISIRGRRIFCKRDFLSEIVFVVSVIVCDKHMSKIIHDD